MSAIGEYSCRDYQIFVRTKTEVVTCELKVGKHRR